MGVKDEVIPALAETGLEGLEVYYPDHTPAMVTRYLEIAKRLGLLVTGGTDFHGGGLAPEGPPGSQNPPAAGGGTPEERYAQTRQQAANRRPPPRPERQRGRLHTPGRRHPTR